MLLFLRQLEAIIRMSESLAKMSLSPFATEVHVDEALRLFQVSTLEAAMSGNLSGIATSLCNRTFTTNDVIQARRDLLQKVIKKL